MIASDAQQLVGPARRFFLFADFRERGRIVRCWYGEGGGWASLWAANSYREAQAAEIISRVETAPLVIRNAILKIGRVRPYSLLLCRPSAHRRLGQHHAGSKKPRRHSLTAL